MVGFVYRANFDGYCQTAVVGFVYRANFDGNEKAEKVSVNGAEKQG